MRIKNTIGKVAALIAALGLLMLLAACQNSDDNQNVEPDNTPAQVDQSIYHAKYKEAMQNLLESRIFPNGEEAYTNQGEDADIWGENDFAVTDIDGDGIDELLIQFANAPTVGEVFFIFQYDPDSDSFKAELTDFPAVDFFEDGWMTIRASHNQGMAGEFWPYAIYKYNAEKDVYEQQYYIDAWDKAYFPQDYQGNEYPSDVDTSKTGTVYYLYEDITKAVEPVDKTEYDKLVARTYGGSAEIMVDYKQISEENIAAITE